MSVLRFRVPGPAVRGSGSDRRTSEPGTRNPEPGTSEPGTRNLNRERFELPNRLCAVQCRLIERRLKRFFERHHQLDSIERAQSQLVHRRFGRDVATARRSARRSTLDGVPAAAGVASPDDSPAAQRWISRRFSFCVPSVRGSDSPGQIDVLQTR